MNEDLLSVLSKTFWAGSAWHVMIVHSKEIKTLVTLFFSKDVRLIYKSLFLGGYILTAKVSC